MMYIIEGEAKKEIKDRPLSFLRVDRPETSFDDSVGTYDDCVYDKARELFSRLQDDGILTGRKTMLLYL